MKTVYLASPLGFSPEWNSYRDKINLRPAELGFRDCRWERLCRGLAKKCCGLRKDFRDSGDFGGIPINLQVLYWIESGEGKLFRRIDEILL